MPLTVIDHHSLDLDRLPNGATVLDVGCHGWNFTATLAARGCTVWAMDPAPDIVNPGIKGVVYLREALVGVGVEAATLIQTPDRNGWHLDLPQTPASEYPACRIATITLPALMERECVHKFHAVKLNCEGAESGILATWPGPIAEQIVVSFHCHTRAQTREECDRLVSRMGEWYDVTQHAWDERYGAGYNYWDTVLTLR